MAIFLNFNLPVLFDFFLGPSFMLLKADAVKLQARVADPNTEHPFKRISNQIKNVAVPTYIDIPFIILTQLVIQRFLSKYMSTTSSIAVNDVVVVRHSRS